MEHRDGTFTSGPKSAESNRTQISVKIPSANQEDVTISSTQNISQDYYGSEIQSSLSSPHKYEPVHLSPEKSRQKSRNVSIVSPHSAASQRLSTIQNLNVRRQLAARIIERAWLSFRDRNMYKLLKHSICAAEHSLSYEILRKVSPKEAEFLKDPTFGIKVRFRFGGQEFPPMIYFKIYHNSKTSKPHYISGKTKIKPASEAARDACDMMGNRKFYDQVIQDTIHHQQFRITDEVDITTVKDYMQYKTALDETPASMGGRDNMWRKLTLDVLPRTTIFYDVVDFIYSHNLTPRLRQELPTLISRPITQDLQLKHIQVISRMRTPPPVNTPHPTLRSRISSRKTDVSSRRSRQAQKRATKMRQMYGLDTRENSNVNSIPFDEDDNLDKFGGNYSGDEEEEWEQEAEDLYAWTQELPDDIIETPGLIT